MDSTWKHSLSPLLVSNTPFVIALILEFLDPALLGQCFHRCPGFIEVIQRINLAHAPAEILLQRIKSFLTEDHKDKNRGLKQDIRHRRVQCGYELRER